MAGMLTSSQSSVLLLEAAQKLDLSKTAEVIDLLAAMSPRALSPHERKLWFALLTRAIRTLRGAGQLSDGHLATGLGFVALCHTPPAPDQIWPFLMRMPAAATALGPQISTAAMLMALWPVLPGAQFAIQYDALNRAFLAGNATILHDLWCYLLRDDKGFVPDYWLFQSHARSVQEAGLGRAEEVAATTLVSADRHDLAAVFDIYLRLLRQHPVAQTFTRIDALTDPVQRERITEYLLGAPLTDTAMPLAVASHDRLAPAENLDDRALMQARLCAANGDWDGVLHQTATIGTGYARRHDALCLEALASARQGQTARALQIVDHLRHNHQVPWYKSARAVQIGATACRIAEGREAAPDLGAPALPVLAGRPLVQSLWVGKRLRWIEDLSIRSYLANGWRYQLYVYDLPENLPQGVEVLDAAAIVPRAQLYQETHASGAHRGSLGAFSDYFRYSLLHRRGGMWTDTDVINLDRFDPEGQALIGTEVIDAGITGFNGAMMAARAECSFQRRAMERAGHILDQGKVYFTRIGPELLAELSIEDLPPAYRLLPTWFLNPISWLETGQLLAPFDTIARLPVLARAPNLHVYTETWRVIGLDLHTPPKGDGFLATLYDRLMHTSGIGMRQLMSGDIR